MSTFNPCGALVGNIVECRPLTTGGTGDRIYLAKRRDIESVDLNPDGSVYNINFVSSAAFYAYDCRVNQNGFAVVFNGGDGAGSLNSTKTMTFSIEGFNQDTINIASQLQRLAGLGLVAIFTTNEQTANNENRAFIVGYDGKGLNIANAPTAGVGTALTDATGFSFELSGTTTVIAAEITPTPPTTNSQFIASILAP